MRSNGNRASLKINEMKSLFRYGEHIFNHHPSGFRALSGLDFTDSSVLWYHFAIKRGRGYFIRNATSRARMRHFYSFAAGVAILWRISPKTVTARWRVGETVRISILCKLASQFTLAERTSQRVHVISCVRFKRTAVCLFPVSSLGGSLTPSENFRGGKNLSTKGDIESLDRAFSSDTSEPYEIDYGEMEIAGTMLPTSRSRLKYVNTIRELGCAM